MLTARQKQLFDFLAASAARGEAPSYEEMADAVGIASKSGVHRLVLALEERGFVRRLPGRARAIEIAREPRADAPDAELARSVAAIAASGYADTAAYRRALRALRDLARRNGVSLAEPPRAG